MGQSAYLLNLFSLVHLACIICQTTWGNASSNHMVSRFTHRILTYVNSLESCHKHWSTSIVGQWMDNLDDSLLTLNSFLYHILNKSLKCFLCGYYGYKNLWWSGPFFIFLIYDIYVQNTCKLLFNNALVCSLFTTFDLWKRVSPIVFLYIHLRSRYVSKCNFWCFRWPILGCYSEYMKVNPWLCFHHIKIPYSKFYPLIQS